MKILYSAFECNPLKGSDMYVGWSWANKMSMLHDVHVLTSAHNKDDIETYSKSHRIKAIFHYIDVPSWVNNIPKGYFLRYLIWNKIAYRYAKSLHKEMHFDIVHHVSIADFRMTGDLWRLRGVKYVYGPVGGGQTISPVLAKYVGKHKLVEKMREIINYAALSLPSYKKAIRNSTRVFVSNYETIAVMRKYLGHNVEFMQDCELGIDKKYLESRKELTHSTSEKVHILLSGRLKYRKGVAFLLDAVARMKTTTPFVVDIYGSGEEWANLLEQRKTLNLENKVIMHGNVSYEKMQKINMTSDIYVLPSLRETTGTAVVEAMANKLPVVALEQNGVKLLVGKECGMLVPISDNLDSILNDFANVLDTLVENKELRTTLGNNGYQRLLDQYTWEAKMKKYSEIYNSICK